MRRGRIVRFGAAAILAGLPAGAAPPPADAPPVAARIRALSHTDWAEREKAQRELVALGARAVPALADFAAGSGDAEAVTRAQETLRRIGWPALVHLLNPADDGTETRPGWIAAREACVRAFLEDAIGRRALANNDWVQGEPLRADAARLHVVWESGSGHGHSLRLYRFHRAGDAMRVERIGYRMRRAYASANPPEDYPVTVETTDIAREPARAMLALALRACAVRLEPKPAAADDGLVGRRRVWMSTGDFHSRVRIEEGARIVFDDSYTGYPGSRHEKQYVRVDACSGVFAAALRGLAWKARQAREDDRLFLLDRTGRFGRDAWWVRERLLVIVGALGDRRFEPFLRKVIELPLEKVTRLHYYAMNAYARITGVDLRTKPVESLDVAAVRKAYLARFAGAGKASEPEKQ
jgi:hypothetical protein